VFHYVSSFSIVQNYSEFWVREESDLLTLAATSENSTPPATTSASDSASIPINRAATADIMVRLHGKWWLVQFPGMQRAQVLSVH